MIHRKLKLHYWTTAATALINTLQVISKDNRQNEKVRMTLANDLSPPPPIYKFNV